MEIRMTTPVQKSELTGGRFVVARALERSGNPRTAAKLIAYDAAEKKVAAVEANLRATYTGKEPMMTSPGVPSREFLAHLTREADSSGLMRADAAYRQSQSSVTSAIDRVGTGRQVGQVVVGTALAAHRAASDTIDGAKYGAAIPLPGTSAIGAGIGAVVGVSRGVSRGVGFYRAAEQRAGQKYDDALKAAETEARETSRGEPNREW